MYPTTTTLVFALGFGSLLMVCCGFWLAYRQQRQQLDALSKRLERLQSAFDMTSDCGIGVGRKVMAMEKRLQATELKQNELESTDIQKVSYNEAVRLLGMGAAVEDLVRSCGLTRAEANLLKALQTSQPKHQARNR